MSDPIRDIVNEYVTPGTNSISPTTTQEEDKHTAGQRRINLVWEVTQAAIAILVVGANVYAALAGVDSILLANAFFLVIGFYFGRTNHSRTGGISKD